MTAPRKWAINIWIKPEVVAEIKFTERTHGDVLRHAEFAALREDKDPKEVDEGRSSW